MGSLEAIPCSRESVLSQAAARQDGQLAPALPRIGHMAPPDELGEALPIPGDGLGWLWFP